jgi:hypothetical protein
VTTLKTLTPLTTLSTSARGTATADEIWSRYADVRRWSQWAPQIRRVDADGDTLRAGLSGTVRPLVGPGVRFVVEDVDAAARTWAWRVRLGPVGLVRMHLVHGVEPDGSTWLRVTGLLPVVAGYLPLARFALGRLVKA